MIDDEVYEQMGRTYTKHLAQSMQQTKAILMGEILEQKDRYIVDVWRGGYRIIVQRWNGTADVVGDYLTKQQADAILKIMEGNNYGDS